MLGCLGRLAAHRPRGRGRAPRRRGPPRDPRPRRAPRARTVREIGFAPGRGRRLRLDGEPVRSLAAWRARAVLVFLPDELRAVKGPPAARRRALDRVLEAASPGFADDLAAYQRGPRPAQRAPAPGPRGRGLGGQPPRLGGADGRARGARGGRPPRRASAALAEPFAALAGRARRRRRRAALRLETVAVGPRARSPTTGLEEALAAALRERRPREIAGRPDAVGARTATTSGSAPAPPTCAARAARASSARPRSRCCWRPATTCARAPPGRSCCSTTCSASSTRDRRRLLLEAVRDGGQTIVTSADPAARRRPGGARPTRSSGWRTGALRAERPAPRRRRHRREPAAGARRRSRASGAGRAAAARGAPRPAPPRAAWPDVVGRGRRRPQRPGAPHPRRRAHRRLLQRVVGAGADDAPRRAGARASPRAAPDAGVTALRFSVADHVVRRGAAGAAAAAPAARRPSPAERGRGAPPRRPSCDEPALRDAGRAGRRRLGGPPGDRPDRRNTCK